MTDYDTLQQADLEPAAPPQAPAADMSGYDELSPGDMAAPKPFSPTPSRVPQAVLDRFQTGGGFDRVYNAAAGAFKDGAAAVDIPGDQMLKDIQDLGLGPKPGSAPSFANGLRWWSQSLLYPAAMAGNFVNQVMHGAKEAAVAGTTQTATEAGAEPKEAQQIGAGVGSILEYVGTDLNLWGLNSHAGRVEIDNTTGAMHDLRIGAVPDHVEAAFQANQIATHYGLPEIAPVIARLFNDQGRLPAEVAHDIQNHPEMLGELAAGETPRAYATATTPQAATSLPVVNTAEISRLAREESLKELDTHLAAQQEALPEGDATAQDRLARLQTVEDQLKNPDIAPPDRKALMDRRDQILVDTNPEELKAAAQPLVDRRNIEAQRSRIADQLTDIQSERTAAQAETALAPEPKMQEGPSVPLGREPGEASSDPLEPARPHDEPLPEGTPVAPVEPSGELVRQIDTTPTPGEPQPAVQIRGSGVTPIKGTGETVTRGLSESATQATTEAGGEAAETLPTYERAPEKPQLDAINAIIEKDPDKAVAMAMGKKAPPRGSTREAAYVAVLNWANRTGRFAIARDLATRSGVLEQATQQGRNIGMFKNIDKDNATDLMISVKDARQADMAKRGMEPASPAAQEEIVADAQKAVKVAKVAKPTDWENFLHEIECK